MTRYSTDSFIYRFFIRRENHALIPSIEQLPFGCAMLHYIIIIIFINCDWVVTRWEWLFYMYTNYEIGY